LIRDAFFSGVCKVLEGGYTVPKRSIDD